MINLAIFTSHRWLIYHCHHQIAEEGLEEEDRRAAAEEQHSWRSEKPSDHKDLDSQAVGNQPWVNNLNLFFNRFDRTSSPPPALLPRQYTSPTASSFPTALSSQPPPHCCPHYRHLLTDTLQHAARPLLQPAPHDTQGEEPAQSEEQYIYYSV